MTKLPDALIDIIQVSQAADQISNELVAGPIIANLQSTQDAITRSMDGIDFQRIQDTLQANSAAAALKFDGIDREQVASALEPLRETARVIDKLGPQVAEDIRHLVSFPSSIVDALASTAPVNDSHSGPACDAGPTVGEEPVLGDTTKVSSEPEEARQVKEADNNSVSGEPTSNRVPGCSIVDLEAGSPLSAFAARQDQLAADTRVNEARNAKEFRAKTVAKLIDELNNLRPQMFEDEPEYNRLRALYPEYLTFRVAANRPDLKQKVLSIQGSTRHIRLAQELAAAHHGRKLSTIQDDWKDHKPPKFKRRP